MTQSNPGDSAASGVTGGLPPVRLRSVEAAILLGILVAALLVSVNAALRGAYVGQDWPMHLTLLREPGRSLSFSQSSPPAIYLLGNACLRIAGEDGFGETLSIVLAAMNLAALWALFRWLPGLGLGPVARLSFAAFITFLPLRMIHATTYAADALTIPVFVLVLSGVRRWIVRPGAVPARLTAALALAQVCKYTFMVLVPILALVLWLHARVHGWRTGRTLRVIAAAAGPACLVLLLIFWGSLRSAGVLTSEHVPHEDRTTGMAPLDLVLPKWNDWRVLQAPEYFHSDLLEPHRYSYAALVHLCLYSDPMNLFQSIPFDWKARGYAVWPNHKVRTPAKNRLMRASVATGLFWTALALCGAGLALADLARTLRDRGAPAFLQTVYLFALGLFLIVFCALPFVPHAYVHGYWTPRLILAPVLAAFLAGFVLVDRAAAAAPAWRGWILSGIGLATLVQTALHVALLI